MSNDRWHELHTGWRQRNPWLDHRVVMQLAERDLETLADLRRHGLDAFRGIPNVGKKSLRQLRWLVERGEEPMPPEFRFPKPELSGSIWRRCAYHLELFGRDGCRVLVIPLTREQAATIGEKCLPRYDRADNGSGSYPLRDVLLSPVRDADADADVDSAQNH